jgi:type IV pilus assembly protein PilW
MLAPNTRRARMQGLTLIELMISLVLGMVLVGGVLVVFLGSQTTYKTSDNLSKMQDSARISFALISHEIREAAGTGCGNGSRLDNAISRRNESILNAAQATTPAWWSVMGNGVQGYDGGTASPAIAIGTGTTQRISTTDAIQLTGAYGSGFSIDAHNNTGYSFTLNTATSGLSANDILIACDYKQSTVLNASTVTGKTVTYAAGAGSARNCGTALGFDADNNCSTTAYKYDSLVARLYRFGASTWYIGNGTNGRPSLYRVFLNGTPEEIAPGVTDMQIQYLQNGNTAYVDAASITDWTAVIAVRVTLNFEGMDKNVATGSSGDRRISTVATSTIMLRNRTP